MLTVIVPSASLLQSSQLRRARNMLMRPTLTPNEPRYRSGTGQRDLVSNIFIGEFAGGATKAIAAPIMGQLFPRLFADEAVGQVESRIVANAAQGAKFESRVLGIIGETKNTTRIMQGEATGAAYRVPDVLTEKIGNVVGEIKSTTGTLRLTNQFKDLLRYAGDTNSTLKIYLQSGAKLDAKLTDAPEESRC